MSLCDTGIQLPCIKRDLMVSAGSHRHTNVVRGPKSPKSEGPGPVRFEFSIQLHPTGLSKQPTISSYAVHTGNLLLFIKSYSSAKPCIEQRGYLEGFLFPEIYGGRIGKNDHLSIVVHAALDWMSLPFPLSKILTAFSNDSYHQHEFRSSSNTATSTSKTATTAISDIIIDHQHHKEKDDTCATTQSQHPKASSESLQFQIYRRYDGGCMGNNLWYRLGNHHGKRLKTTIHHCWITNTGTTTIQHIIGAIVLYIFDFKCIYLIYVSPLI